MTAPSPSATPTAPFTWQEEKRLRSGDRVWILTDVYCYSDSYLSWSTPQEWFKVGIYDLTTRKIGFARFSLDDAASMLRSGVKPAPWHAPQPAGIELTRIYHGPTNEGRFRERVTLIELEPELAVQGPILRQVFEKMRSFDANARYGMWSAMERSAARVRAIESAALSMPTWFSAGDVKALVGEKVNVTSTLAQLVREGQLETNLGKKRGVKYRVPPAPTPAKAADLVLGKVAGESSEETAEAA